MSYTKGTKTKTFVKEMLTVKIFINREEMGREAADDVSMAIGELLKRKEEINIIFAAAPSQNDFFEVLIEKEDIEWGRINAFHMDEYIGLSKDAPQAFGNFLRERIFGVVPFKNVFYIDGLADDTDKECERYSDLLLKYPVDIVCLGIGENGHIAFNDPPVADFNDKQLVKVIKLDEMSRQQQVNDKCFSSIDDVPVDAYTLTIPSLMRASHMFCIVPAENKAQAVYNTLNSVISEECPATILRTKKGAVLYLDQDSASLYELNK